MVNEPSVFEPLKFYCMTDYLEISDSEDESTRRRRATTTGMDNTTILRMGDHLIFLITQNGKIPVKWLTLWFICQESFSLKAFLAHL